MMMYTQFVVLVLMMASVTATSVVLPSLSSEEDSTSPLLDSDAVTLSTSAEDVVSFANNGLSIFGRRRPSLRPSLIISERILPIQLVDTPDDQMRVPRRKQLRVQTLMATLGKDFDPSWMAIEKPEILVEEPVPISDGLRQPSPKLLTEIGHLNLSHDFHSLPASTVKTFEYWLMKKASCPVRYVWDDVGPLFWPPWIKRGECVNAPAAESCSWPLGMHCVPAESVTIHLLRWHCRLRSNRKSSATAGGGNNNKLLKQSTRPRKLRQVPHHNQDHKQFRCQWLKVPYPVTAECFCSC